MIKPTKLKIAIEMQYAASQSSATGNELLTILDRPIFKTQQAHTLSVRLGTLTTN